MWSKSADEKKTDRLIPNNGSFNNVHFHISCFYLNYLSNLIYETIAVGQYPSIRHMEWNLFLSFIESFRASPLTTTWTMVYQMPDGESDCGFETDHITWYVP